MGHNIEQQFLKQYSQLELIARQVVEGFITGLHKSPFHGFSVEFAEHRLYNNGESTRHIDWKLYAKTDKLFIKRFEEETNLRCQLIIDTSGSMYYPDADVNDPEKFSKIKFSVYAAAALSELFRKQRDAVGLSLFNKEIDFHSPSKANRSHQRMVMHKLEELLSKDKAESHKRTNAAESLHKIAMQLHRRSLIILFSDMMETADETDREKLFQALQHLKHSKHEVILFHTVEKQHEMEFNFGNQPYHFVDTETAEEIKLHPKDVKEEYLKKIQAYRRQLKLKCGQFGIEFIEAPIDEGFNKILLPYLVQRKKMK